MTTFDKPPLEAVYIAHFGVKGMKWGVRRFRPSVSRSDVKNFLKRNSGKIVLGSAAVVGKVLHTHGKLGVTAATTAKFTGRSVAFAARYTTRGATFVVNHLYTAAVDTVGSVYYYFKAPV